MGDNVDWDAELNTHQRGARNQTMKPSASPALAAASRFGGAVGRTPPGPPRGGRDDDDPGHLPPPPPPPTSSSSPPSRAPPSASPFRKPPPPPAEEAPPPPPSSALSPASKPRTVNSSSYGNGNNSTTPSPSNSFGSSSVTSLRSTTTSSRPYEESRTAPSSTVSMSRTIDSSRSGTSTPSYSPTNSTRSVAAGEPEKKGFFSRIGFGKNKDKDDPKSSSGSTKESSQSNNRKRGDDDDDDDDDEDPWANTGADDDDDGMSDNPWAEFTDAKGNKLFFNRATGQAALGKIPSPSDQEQEDEDDDDDDDSMPNTLNDDMFAPRGDKKARRNSSILSEAWDQRGGGRRGGDEPIKAMSVDKIVKSLSLIEKQVDLILSHSQNLSPAICEDLRTIRSRVAQAQQSLEEEGGHAVDNRGDVEALTEFDRLPWNFNNMHVDHYRAAVARVPHHEYEYREWHAPQYLSTFPLPPGVKTVTCVVRLPDMENALMTHTRINVTEKDTVSAAIHMAFAKCKGLGDERDYVLKGSGLKDFMYGDQPLMDYEYIRLCMRDSSEVKLTLIRRPPAIPPIPADAPDLPQEYRNKVNPNIAILSKEDHRNLSSRDNWEEMKAVPMSELSLPFRVRVIGIDGVTEQGLPRMGDGVTHIILRTFLFHGTQKIPDSIKETEWVPSTSEPRWQTWLMAEYSKDTVLNALPRAVRIGFLVIGRDAADKEIPLGWSAVQLIDERGFLATGPRQYRLWGFPPRKKGKHKTREVDPDFIYRACTRENVSDPHPAVLHVHFDEYVVPVVAPLTEKYREPNPRVVGAEVPLKTLSKQQQKQLEDIIDSDPLYSMSPDDKALVWMMRHSLTKYPQVLPKFLLCVNWGSPDHKFEAHRLMNQWAPPFTPSAALELLDAKYPDYVVREYAVNCLRRLPEDELRLYLLQFGQAIKYEPYHDSPLVRYLMERALKSPFGVGHHFFWHLKAELHNPQVAERFGVILEEYLSHAGHYTKELRKQNSAVLKLQRVAEMIVRLKREHQYGDADAMKEYVKELEKLNADFFGPMGKFQIPLNPKLEATTLIVEKCRYMSSKMVPLWLVFNNADEDAPPIYLIFKSGDDLRQDILTLQMLQVMDKIWLSNGLDLKMKPYKTVATGVNDNGDGVGMIEVVMNSDTTSGIQLKYGGGAMGALKMDPLDLFLKDHNKGKALYDKAVDNFVCSCAGYCVATFVLGIGDRHNGNIMVTKDGHLFHIDFGHFLGNFKKKFGVNRERAAFVFTPEMAFVMGGKKYKNSTLFKKFLVLCSKAFKTLRANATLMENLFNLMVAAGMPELMKEEDIHYLRDKLYLMVSEKKADKKLHGEIKKSLESTYRRIDNWIHNMVHG